MWLYFNSNGQLTTILEHGSPARVGSTNFSIFAVFEDITDATSLASYSATIKLKKPDFTGSSYPTMLMTPASSVFSKLTSETNTGDFSDGSTYYGFLFDFNELVDIGDDTHLVVLDTNGLWKAVVTLINEAFFVQGVATFDVGGSGSEEETSISYDVVTNQLVSEINKKAAKDQVIIVIDSSSSDVSSYENGQFFYSALEQIIYQKVNGALVPIGTFDVDAVLSTTSEKPVQNKVITQALNNCVDLTSYQSITGTKNFSTLGVSSSFYSTNENHLGKLSVASEANFYSIANFVYSLNVTTGGKINRNAIGYGLKVPSTEGYVSDKYLATEDDIQNVREVAEGKCKSIVISYSSSVPTTDAEAQLLKKMDGTNFTDLTDFADYVEYNNVAGICINSRFNSQNSDIAMAQGSSEYIITKDNHVLKAGASDVVDFGLKTGDLILVVETDVPDRWWAKYADSAFKLETSKVPLENYFAKGESAIPTNNGTQDLGSEYYTWRDLYLSGTAYSDKVRGTTYTAIGIDISSGAVRSLGHFYPNANGSYSLGAAALKWKDLYLNGGVVFDNGRKIQNSGGYFAVRFNNDSNNAFLIGDTIAYTRGVLPLSGNYYDLGSASAKYKDFYLAGNITDGTNSVTVAEIGKVKTVNNVAPDASGNVSIPTTKLYKHELTRPGQAGRITVICTRSTAFTLLSDSNQGLDISNAVSIKYFILYSGSPAINGIVNNTSTSSSGTQFDYVYYDTFNSEVKGGSDIFDAVNDNFDEL